MVDLPEFRQALQFCPLSKKDFPVDVNIDVWKKCLKHNCISMGYNGHTDLTRIRKLLDSGKSDEAQRELNQLESDSQMKTFLKLKKGNLIFANYGQDVVLAVGVVTVPYQRDPQDLRKLWSRERPHDYLWRNVVRVKWLENSAGSLPLPRGKNGRGWSATIKRIADKNRVREFAKRLSMPLDEGERLMREAKEKKDAKKKKGGKSNRTDKKPRISKILLWETPSSGGLDWKIQELLSYSKTRAVLLYGPAGTGKTFAATQLAKRYGGKDGGRVEQVQFHPAYSYEDFMEGLRPERDKDGQVSYEVKDGVFKEFCKKARDNPDKGYLFIIDEINRGNVPKVMGELMYCLEYRGEEHAVKLPYGKKDNEGGDGNAKRETFFIPDNVHILGTMNSSDRSVALLDVALRRRFHFVELRPDPKLLENVQVEGEADLKLSELLDALNRRILKEKGRHYLLGHSYFLPHDYPNKKEISLDEIKRRWFHQILPLLEEYFADDVEALRRVIRKEWEGPAQSNGEHFVPRQPEDMEVDDFIKELIALSKPLAKGSSGKDGDDVHNGEEE